MRLFKERERNLEMALLILAHRLIVQELVI
jgi:hypothetical protein